MVCLTPVSPAGSKEAIGVRESRAELFEVAVEWRGETLEGNSKLSVQRLKHRHWQGPLQARPFVSSAAKHNLDGNTRTHTSLTHQLTEPLPNTDCQVRSGKP